MFLGVGLNICLSGCSFAGVNLFVLFFDVCMVGNWVLSAFFVNIEVGLGVSGTKNLIFGS